jgi:hypothetical protein
MPLKSLLFACLLSVSLHGCNSVALSVEDLSRIELTPASPFILADTTQIELRLFAPDLDSDIRVLTQAVTPIILEPSIRPFTLLGQRFESDFEMTLVLGLIGGGTPGETVDLAFVLFNAHGYFDMHATVEFY